MHKALLLTFFVIGCSSEEKRPIGGGGNIIPGHRPDAQQADAAPPSTPDAMPQKSISGRLCIIEDVRTPALCSNNAPPSGITIQIGSGGDSTTTSDTGAFTLPGLDVDTTELRIAFNDANYRSMVFPLALTNGQVSGVQIPLISQSSWQSLLDDIGVAEPPGAATLLTYLRKNNTPVSGVTLIAPSGGQGIPFYDNKESSSGWLSGVTTGEKGASLIFGVPSSQNQVSFTAVPAAGTPVTAMNIPVSANALTLITLSLP